MDILFSTGSIWSYSTARCFLFASQARFDGIELMVDQRWETRQVDFLKSLVDQYQLPILAVHSPFLPNIPGWPDDQPGRIKETLKLAEKLDSEVIVHHLPSRIGYMTVIIPGRIYRLPIPTKPENGYRKWLENEYLDFQSQTPIKLCIENMPAYQRFGQRWNYSHWNTVEEIARFENITFDTTHLGTWGFEPIEVYPSLKGKVAHIHLSNYNGTEHLRPETGNLQLDKLMSQLASDGYRGAVTMELHPEALDAGLPDERVIQRMSTSLNFIRQWAGVSQ
jgi:sugar phosphate isomerase/epimerase